MKTEQDTTLLNLRLETGRTVEEELRSLKGFARLLDARFEVFGVRFGLDALIGLIPVAGDGVTLIAGLFSIGTAIRLQLSPLVILGLIWTLLVDAGIGAIPIVGDIFDFFFRSHKRNFLRIEKELIRKAKRASGKADRAPAVSTIR